MNESKSGSDDSSSSSSDSSIPSEQERSSEEDDNNNTRTKSAAEDDVSVASSSSSSSEEEQQQEEEGYMFNNKLYPTYQEMVAAKQERNRQVLERTTSEISLMLGSDYGSNSKASSSKKKKKPSKKLNKPSDGPPRRNPKRKARSPSSSSISTSSHHHDIPRKRSKSIGSSSRNSTNSSDVGGSISGKVPSDVFMDNESIATQSTIDNNEMLLLQPYNRLVKDICIQTEQILVNGKRIQERERIYQEFRKRSGGDRLYISQTTKQARVEEEDDDDDDMSTHEDITSTVDWKLFHSSITIDSLTQGNGGNIGKNIRHDRDKAVEIVNPKISRFLDDEDDIVIPEEYLASAEETDTYQQQTETLPINNPAKYNNIIQERNTYYTSKGIDRYWDEQYGDGIDPDLFVEKCCKGSEPSIDGNSFNITGTQDEDSMKAKKRYMDSLLQRCWDRAVNAASSTLTVPLSDEAGVELEGAVKTEEEDNSSLPNRKDIDSALHQKARDAVDGILDTLLTKDSILRLKLEDPKLKHQVDWCDVLDCLKAAIEKQEKTRGEEGVLDHSLMKSLSIRLIERYGIGNNG